MIRRAALAAAVVLIHPLLAQDGGTLYVANQDDATVSVIALASQTVVATVDLRAFGFGPTARPHHTQVEPDGSYWYVTLIGAGRVLKLDRENRLVGAAELEVPGLMALDPRHDLMVVGRSMSAVNPPASLVVIRRSDMRILDRVDVFFPRPHALAADPRGGRFYVASLGVNQLASVAVDSSGAAAVQLVDVPGPARGIVQAAVEPAGRWLALTAQLSGQVLLFDLADPERPALARSIPVQAGAFEPAFLPDGSALYTSNFDANNASRIAAATWMETQVIRDSAFAQPHGIAVSPDGRWVFIGNRHQTGGAHDHAGGRASGAGRVLAVCAATGRVVRVIPVGAYAAGLSLWAPPQGRSPPGCP